MKLNSKYFDDIRVKPENDRTAKQNQKICEWEGCEEAGEHRAPGGRDALNKFRHFCLKHVREYNSKYNYFEGLDDDAMRAHQRESQLGERPTWRFGVERDNLNANSAPPPHMSSDFLHRRWQQEHAKRSATRSGKIEAKKKINLTPAAQKAFDTMGLEGGSNAETIKVKYKELVKRLHPDANGGDRKYEERLREIISAYTYLKRSGYC